MKFTMRAVSCLALLLSLSASLASAAETRFEVTAVTDELSAPLSLELEDTLGDMGLTEEAETLTTESRWLLLGCAQNTYACRVAAGRRGFRFYRTQYHYRTCGSHLLACLAK